MSVLGVPARETNWFMNTKCSYPRIDAQRGTLRNQVVKTIFGQSFARGELRAASDVTSDVTSHVPSDVPSDVTSDVPPPQQFLKNPEKNGNGSKAALALPLLCPVSVLALPLLCACSALALSLLCPCSCPCSSPCSVLALSLMP